MSLSLGNNYLPITVLNEYPQSLESSKEPQQSPNKQQVKPSPIEEFWIALHKQVAKREDKPSYETLEKLIRTLKQKSGSGNLNSEDLLFIKKLAEKYEFSCSTEEWQQLFWKSYSASLSKL